MDIIFFRHSLLNRGGDKMVIMHANHLVTVGHKVTIVVNVIDTIFEIKSSVKIVKIEHNGIIGTLRAACAKKYLCDFLIVDIIPLVIFLSSRNSDKILYYAQDYDEFYYKDISRKILIRLFYFIAFRLLKIPAIAVSTYLADIFNKRFQVKVRVVENGVDPSVFYHEPDLDLVEAKGQRKSVLLLSRVDKRKGFDLALQVVSGLKDRFNEGIEIWTVGQAMKQDIIGVRTRHFGFVAETKLRRVLSSSDLLLYPSRHEGFALMVLEAFACRCPVVTTTAVPFARHKNNSLVAEVGDIDGMIRQCVDVINNEVSISTIIDSAYVLSRSKCVEKTKLEFENALHEMLEHRKNYV